MKKLVLLSALFFGLTGCNSANTNQSNSANKIFDTPKESVSLTAKNFSTYVACNSTVAFNTTSYDYANYFTYFIGADYCKFVNCTVTYGYAYMDNEYSGVGETVSLTLSGDGQTNLFHARLNNSSAYYRFVVLNASGIVEVYR